MEQLVPLAGNASRRRYDDLPTNRSRQEYERRQIGKRHWATRGS